MDATESGIIAFLREKAEARWQEKQPYPLSLAAAEIKSEGGIDYRAVLRDERLKAFVKRTQNQGGYKLIEHPNQKAKLVIVPTAAEFEFPVETSPTGAKRDDSSEEHSERALVQFLRALAKLSDDEIDGVVIPTSVLVKLVGRR